MPLTFTPNKMKLSSTCPPMKTKVGRANKNTSIAHHSINGAVPFTVLYTLRYVAGSLRVWSLVQGVQCPLTSCPTRRLFNMVLYISLTRPATRYAIPRQLRYYSIRFLSKTTPATLTSSSMSSIPVADLILAKASSKFWMRSKDACTSDLSTHAVPVACGTEGETTKRTFLRGLYLNPLRPEPYVMLR